MKSPNKRTIRLSKKNVTDNTDKIKSKKMKKKFLINERVSDLINKNNTGKLRQIEYRKNQKEKCKKRGN